LIVATPSFLREAGKLNLYCDRLRRIAQKYRPKGVMLIAVSPEINAFADYNNNKILHHKINYNDNLVEFLHECAHFHLNHKERKVPQWRREYEAETWALSTANKEGIQASVFYVQDSADTIYKLFRNYERRYNKHITLCDDMDLAHKIVRLVVSYRMLD